MQELTIILFVASLAMGALAMSIRKPQTGTYVLSTVLSILAIAAVLDELRRIEAGEGVNDELLDTINLIASIMDGMKEEDAYGI